MCCILAPEYCSILSLWIHDYLVKVSPLAFKLIIKGSTTIEMPVRSPAAYRLGHQVRLVQDQVLTRTIVFSKGCCPKAPVR